MRTYPKASLAALCLGAILVRAVLVWALPNVAHPDETLQYLEQAYRLDTGRGLVPWEYQVGARSWVIPGLVAVVMKFGLAISAAPAVYLGMVTAAMILVAVGSVVAAHALGARIGGDSHAWLAGLLAAFWCEIVALSPHVLADTLSAAALLAAFAVGYRVEAPSMRRMVATGALFGLAFIFRVQLAPAIAIALVATAGLHFRRRLLPMSFGFGGPLLVMGLVDWIALGAPFSSAFTYVRVNAGGVADAFGVSPALAYAGYELGIWRFAAVPIIATAVIGACRMPLVAVTAATIFLTFSLVGHKEARFIFPALPLLFTLCAIGTGDLVVVLASRFRSKPGRIVALVSVAWLALSVATGFNPRMSNFWHRDSGWLAAFAAINADPTSCGLGIEAPDLFPLTGQVRLRADIPLYDGSKAADAASAGGYNRLIQAYSESLPPPAIGAFRRESCLGSEGSVCLYARAGACTPHPDDLLRGDPPKEVEAVLHRLGLL